MANIETLPDEIVMEVVRYLKPAVSMNRPYSLASLSRCSKRFYIFCRPLLYESVFLYMKTMRLLVRSIYKRPELGLLIKYINFAGNTGWGSDSSYDRILVIPGNSMTEDDSHSSKPQDLTWRMAPQGTTTSYPTSVYYDESHWLALLLFESRNLEELEWDGVRDIHPVANLFRFASLGGRDSKILYRLSVMRIWMDDETEIDLGDFLQLPSLKVFAVDNLPFNRSHVEQSTIEYLEVTHTERHYLRPRSFTTILEGCINLREFKMFHSVMRGPWKDNGRILEHILGSLHKSRTTLEVLILEVYTNHRPSNLGILHKFERLEKLHLRAIMILVPTTEHAREEKVHTLPMSLCALAIDLEPTKVPEKALNVALTQYVEEIHLSPSLSELILLGSFSRRTDQKLAVSCLRREIVLTDRVIDSETRAKPGFSIFSKSE